MKLLYREEKTDESEAVQMVAFKILAETLSSSEKYETLRDAYLQLIKDRSSYTGAARDLLISTFSDNISDLKLDLIRFARMSDSKVKGLIGDELKNLA